jgi:RNA polymerase sigma-70 factor (ECF subfamily)
MSWSAVSSTEITTLEQNSVLLGWSVSAKFCILNPGNAATVCALSKLKKIIMSIPTTNNPTSSPDSLDPLDPIFPEGVSLEEASTEQLVEASQTGNNSAFGELVNRFESMVYSICYQRLRNQAEAQEVTQDVLILAFRKLDQLQQPAAFPGWLRSIAIRQSINRQTRRAPCVSVEPQMLDAPDHRNPAPLERLLAHERQDRLHEGLRNLAILDRSTLEAFYLQGQSLLQMSDGFSAPVGTIKRRLHVARKRLAVELSVES